MRCPKCKSNMQVVDYEGISVDRCMDCSGLWFDLLEHEHLKALEGSESIDIGSAKVGQKYNEMARVDCPKCKKPLIKMVDRQQPHIWYEACPSCNGVFFDAGEFRDYREKSILDLFRGLFAKERQ
jgi:Zn-finger nucleic acid-binding protein